ncbi:glycoside hydrolase family 95-like protein [Sphingobacterium cellulitidis]|uniref:glycoside hydrolase family 95-like protein n=1 Tax=Sphingobacterium cellulitidis TaxID=1768011 RepID=UPI0035240919
MIQSKQGYVELLPAIPNTWQDYSFENLRSEGGYLFSSEIVDGKIKQLKIKANHNGTLKLRVGKNLVNSAGKALKKADNYYHFSLKKGEEILLKEG